MATPAIRQESGNGLGAATRWKPGQSGNPKGRPKGIAKQARDLINDEPERLLTILLDVAEDPKAKPPERIAAINAYLDRAYGKAPQHAPVEGGDPLDRDQLDERIGSLVDDLAARRESKGRRPA
jgi:hypothetical protein